MDIFVGIVLFILLLWATWFLITLPVIIAEKRGITGSELSTIRGLAWLGIILPFTWFIGLILALVWQPKKWIDKNESSDLERLEKLHDLFEKKVITKVEYEKERKKVLN